MKKAGVFFLSFVSLLSMSACSGGVGSFNPNNVVYYYVQSEESWDNGQQQVKQTVVVFDVDKKDEFKNTIGEKASYGMALSVRDNVLYSYQLSNGYNSSDSLIVYKQSVPVYVFGEEIIPEAKNDGNGLVFGANMYSIHYDSGRMVVQSPTNVSKLATTFLVTEKYAKDNGMEIVKL